MLSNQSVHNNLFYKKYNPALGGISLLWVDLLSTSFVRVYNVMTFKEIYNHKELKNLRGVYRIQSSTGRFYIGSTTGNFYTRLTSHLSRLRAGNNLCKKIQREYNKYGEDSFTISIVEYIEEKELIQQKETLYIRDLFKLDKGDSFFNENSLNICRQSGSTLGRRQSEETKALISTVLKGKMAGNKHPLWGTKREPTFLGKKHTEASLEKMRTKRTMVVSEERRKEISARMGGENHPLFGVPLNENRKRALNRTGHISGKRKPVLMMLNGIVVKEYACLYDAKKDGHSTNHINQCCVGKRKTHHGHQWSLKRGYNIEPEVLMPANKKDCEGVLNKLLYGIA